MTVQLVKVKDLKEGDWVDLENDPYADPLGEVVLLECEFQVVSTIEQETPDCVCVYFADFVCGFPPEHEVKVEVAEAAA